MSPQDTPRKDSHYMGMALAEARRALGWTSPNPCVGAVVVRDGQVVGRGHHVRAGSPHAEVVALADAGDAAQGATIYVTLEPCNHTGRTPPCTRAILEAGIARVVIGMADPNPLASGGAALLRARGLEVRQGVLAADCAAINRPFLKWVETGLPWVALKAGASLDGRLSYLPGRGGAVTGDAARAMVHRLRHRFDAILVGVDTALADDPSLTTRLPGGGGRDPLRVVLDSRLRLPPTARMLTQDSPAPTWVFCGPDAPAAQRQALEAAGAVVRRVPRSGSGLDLNAVLRDLAADERCTLLVEGGGRVHGAFLAADLADEVFLFLAPLFIGDGGTPLIRGSLAEDRGQAPRLHQARIRRVGDDILVRGLLRSPARAEEARQPVSTPHGEDT